MLLLLACTEPEPKESMVAPAPPSEWKAVYGGDSAMCGIKVDGNVACWGPQTDPDWYYYYSSSDYAHYVDIPDYQYTHLSLAAGYHDADINTFGNHGCGVTEDQDVVCWGNNSSYKTTPTLSKATSVAVVDDCSCGVSLEGTITCWGLCLYSFPDTYKYTKIQLGFNNYCALTTERSVFCSQSDWNNIDRVVDLNIHAEYIQALQDDGRLVYAMDSDPPKEINAPATYITTTVYEVYFRSVIVCGITTVGSVDCWKFDPYGSYTMEDTPSGTFISVAISDYVRCAVDTDARMHCWGYDPEDHPEWNPPY